MSFLCHATEGKFVRRRREVLRTDNFSDSDMVDLSWCYFPRPFSSL